jgi:hypothetical protein
MLPQWCSSGKKLDVVISGGQGKMTHLAREGRMKVTIGRRELLASIERDHRR